MHARSLLPALFCGALFAGLHATGAFACSGVEAKAEARAALEAQLPAAKTTEIVRACRLDLDGDGSKDDLFVFEQSEPYGRATALISRAPGGGDPFWQIVWRDVDTTAQRERWRYVFAERDDEPAVMVRWSVSGSGRFLHYDIHRHQTDGSFARLGDQTLTGPIDGHLEGLIFVEPDGAVVRDSLGIWRLDFTQAELVARPLRTGALGSAVTEVGVSKRGAATINGVDTTVNWACTEQDSPPDPRARTASKLRDCPDGADLSVKVILPADRMILVRSARHMTRITTEGPIRTALGPTRLFQPTGLGEASIRFGGPNGPWTTIEIDVIAPDLAPSER